MQVIAQDILDSMDGVTYIVDDAANIVAYGRPNWDRFATDNGCPELAESSNVLDRPLLDFISGDEVCASVAFIMDDVRHRNRPSAIFPCRCDAPSFARKMRMAVSPVGETGALLFQSVTLHEEMRAPINLYDFKTLDKFLGDDSVPILSMCSYCQEVRFPAGTSKGEGRWVKAEEYYRLGGAPRVRISHGVCPQCLALLRRK